jgi:hypothetical protein
VGWGLGGTESFSPPPQACRRGGGNFAGPFSSEAKKGQNHPLFGKNRPEETCNKIRESMGISVKVRDNQTGITNIYYSKTQAAKELSTSLDTVRRYIISGKPYKGRYLISII